MIGRGIGIPFRHGTGGGGTSIPPEIKKSIVAWYSPCLNVGITSQRPGNADNGFHFFDVTLRKPIWWNGSSWVDANGATV